MKLYHGTCEDNAFEIYKSGFLEPNPNNSESATEYIDNLFERYTGKRVRENAIYFWDNIIDTHGYECVVKVNLDDIELNKLYVGDYNSVNDLYHHRDVNEFSIDMSEEEFDTICMNYIRTYMDSFIPYSEYIKNKKSYKSKYTPEFLYFGNAKIELEEEYLEYFDMI